MKKLLTTFILLIVLFNSLKITAQINNLVPNPSFEDYNIEYPPPYVWWCDSVAVCLNWTSPSLGNPDYYNKISCEMHSVPGNEFGYQYAFDGTGYYLFCTYWVYDTVPEAYLFREYIQVKLKETLKQNKEYCVSFYVSLADSAFYATDKIGAYFSDTAISRNDQRNFAFIPQICSPDGYIINDKTNWIQINGHFTAIGDEKYITIGNFYDGYSTNVMNAVAPNSIYNNNGGYYIDMVTVFSCDDTIKPAPEKNNIVYLPNIFSPNSDGANDILFVRGENIKEVTISLYNRWGEKVFESNDITKGWDGTYKGKPCPAEVYVYYVNVTFINGVTEQKNGNITLVR